MICDKFVGPRTRVVAVSTHNPLGVTFAAGVYTSIFGSSKMPINSHYSRQLFAKIKINPYRKNFKVIVGGSGGWQIIQTNTYEELERRLRRRRTKRISRHARAVSQGDSGRGTAARRSTSNIRSNETRFSFPTRAQRSASSR